jgi:glycosyltransferase involved in cell wall biosynthesis
MLFLGSRPDIAGPLPKVLPVVEAAISKAGCELVVLPWGRTARPESIPKKLLRTLGDLVTVIHSCRSTQFDMLVINTAHDWRALTRDLPLLGVACGLRMRDRALVFHGSQPHLVSGSRGAFALLSRLLTRLCTKILVLSSEEMIQWRAVAPHREVEVIRYPRLAPPAAADNDAGVRFNRPALVFAGRLIAEKGIFDLLEATRTVVEKFDCEVVFAGDGPERERLWQRIVALKLDDRVHLTGYLEEAELWRLYRRGAALVLPTRWPEGFPVVILEALEAGLPVITTRIRGAADWLEDGVNGFLIPPGDVLALSEAMCRLLADPGLLKSMRAANRWLALSFNPDVVAEVWLTALKARHPRR